MRKTFFQRPTASQILKYDFVREISENLVYNVLELKPREAVIIKRDLYEVNRWESAEKFMKHGTEIKIKRYTSLDEALEERKTPVQLRKEVFDKVSRKAFCSYSIKPFIGSDLRKRRFFLHDCVEGARIYGYSNREIKGCPNIKIEKVYDCANRVAKEGAEIQVSVPSRTNGASSYKIGFMSVPIIDNNYKWGIANNLLTNHSCKEKYYYIKFPFINSSESAREFRFCAHEIAGYLKIIEYFWNDKKNIIPWQMSQIAIPSQLTANYYMNALNNCLIQTSKDKKLRRLNRAELGIMLGGLIYKLKYDATFFYNPIRDGALRNYKWG